MHCIRTGFEVGSAYVLFRLLSRGSSWRTVGSETLSISLRALSLCVFAKNLTVKSHLRTALLLGAVFWLSKSSSNRPLDGSIQPSWMDSASRLTLLGFAALSNHRD